MIKAYKYLFYQFYQYAKVVEAQYSQHGGIPHYLAFTSVCIVLIYNLLTLAIWTNYLFIKSSRGFTEIHTIVFAVVFMGVNYLALLYKKRYLLIEKEFNALSPKRKKRNKVYFWAFLVISILMFFVVTALVIPPA